MYNQKKVVKYKIITVLYVYGAGLESNCTT